VAERTRRGKHPTLQIAGSKAITTLSAWLRRAVRQQYPEKVLHRDFSLKSGSERGGANCRRNSASRRQPFSLVVSNYRSCRRGPSILSQHPIRNRCDKSWLGAPSPGAGFATHVIAKTRLRGPYKNPSAAYQPILRHFAACRVRSDAYQYSWLGRSLIDPARFTASNARWPGLGDRPRRRAQNVDSRHFFDGR